MASHNNQGPSSGRGLIPSALLGGALCLLLGCGDAKPDGPLQLRVTGDNYDWYIRYPGEDGLLDSDDDVVTVKDMHLPAHTELHIEVTSTDFIYTFRVLEMGQVQMAVPDLAFTLDFDSGPAAVHVLKGDQMCGFSHESLIGEFIVEPAADYRAWLRARKRAGPPKPSGGEG